MLQADTYSWDGSHVHAVWDRRSFNVEGALLTVLKYDGVVESYGANSILETRTHPDGVVESFDAVGIMTTRFTPGVGTSTFSRSTTETSVTLDTRPDGMTGHIHDNGITEVRRSDGTLAERDLPGSIVEIYDATGLIQTRKEPRTGTITYVRHEDGTMTRTFVDGAVQEYRADGTSATLTRADEAVVSLDTAGRLESVVFADGRTGTYVQNEDGSYILTCSDGSRELRRADDSLAWHLRADETWETCGPDARVVVDGSTDGVSRTRDYHADGSWTSTVSDGSVEEHAVDGRLVSTTWPDGRVVTYPGDGTATSVTTWPHHLVETLLANGTTTWTTPQGVTIARDAAAVVTGTASDETALVGTSLSEAAGVQVTLVDGTLFQVLIDGTIQHLAADGATPIETVEASGVDTHYVDGVASRVDNADGSYSTDSPNDVLSSFVPGGETCTVLSDATLGHVRSVTDSSATVVYTACVDAWGNMLAVTDNVPGGMPARYVGALGVRWDGDLGLYYVQHRWYDPGLQQFMSIDPLKSNTDLYEYANAGPEKYVDASGLLPPGGLEEWVQRRADPVRYDIWIQSPEKAKLNKISGIIVGRSIIGEEILLPPLAQQLLLGGGTTVTLGGLAKVAEANGIALRGHTLRYVRHFEGKVAIHFSKSGLASMERAMHNSHHEMHRIERVLRQAYASEIHCINCGNKMVKNPAIPSPTQQQRIFNRMISWFTYAPAPPSK